MAAPRRLLAQAQDYIGAVLGAGDIAVDATLGNGHDALFLARRVGPGGRVYGFDRQAEALAVSRARLRAGGLGAVLQPLLAGHESMASALPDEVHGRVRAVMFNLGYLPGSDKSLVTGAATTLAALTQACALLAPGGRITLMAYTGHGGGLEEAEALAGWLAQQASSLGLGYDCLSPDDTHRHPPRLYRIERLVGGGAAD